MPAGTEIRLRGASIAKESQTQDGTGLNGSHKLVYVPVFLSTSHQSSRETVASEAQVRDTLHMHTSHESRSVKIREPLNVTSGNGHENHTLLGTADKQNRQESIKSEISLHRHGRGFSRKPQNLLEQTTSLQARRRKKREKRRHRKPRKSYDTAKEDRVAVSTERNIPFLEENYTLRYPTPLNKEMEEFQVDGQTGALGSQAVKRYYRRLVKSYLRPFRRGIERDMYFDVLKRKSYHLTPPGGNKGVQTLLVQIINKRVYLLDPYRLAKLGKAFYRSRIREIVWLLNRLLSSGSIHDTEFLLAVHDCVQTVSTDHSYRGATYKESRPIFTIVRCSFSDNIPFPMWEGRDVRGGRLDGWDKKMENFKDAGAVPWMTKVNKAVFRGVNRPSMYFSNRTDADKNCNEVGRTRLSFIAKENPHLYDVSVGGKCGGNLSIMKRLEAVEQQKYKYVLYAEGNCFWADRLNMQIFGSSVVIKQETACGQFWEPLLKPMVHYLPTDFFFTNTTSQIIWAQNHDDEARAIVENANEFASNFLSLHSIELYVEVLLEEYTKLLKHKDKIKLEIGAEELRDDSSFHK